MIIKIKKKLSNNPIIDVRHDSLSLVVYRTARPITFSFDLAYRLGLIIIKAPKTSSSNIIVQFVKFNLQSNPISLK